MRRTRPLALALVCAAGVTGCGTAGHPNQPGGQADVQFADCMRAHGVSNFPDPLPTGGFPRGAAGPPTPASTTALRACMPVLHAGEGSRHAPSAGRLAAALRYARCIRAHGVPRFPDPVTSPASHDVNVIDDAGILFPVGTEVDPGSPAFQRADATCGGRPRGGHPQGG